MVKQKFILIVFVMGLMSSIWLPTAVSLFNTGVVAVGETKLEKEDISEQQSPKKENEEESKATSPVFSFSTPHLTSRVREVFSLTFSSDDEVKEALLVLPKEASLLTDNLPKGLTVEKVGEENQWRIRSDEARTTFDLTVVVEKEGSYEATVGDAKVILEILPKDELVWESESESNEESLEIVDEPNHLPPMESEKQVSQEETMPESRTTSNVRTWAEFQAAINTQTVTVINVTANISGNTSLSNINRDLTINGNGNTINTQGQEIGVTGANRQITVRNMVLTNALTEYGEYGSAFNTVPGASNVQFRFSDIRYTGSGRLVSPLISTADISTTVIFDGGKNEFPAVTDASSLILSATDLRLINNAIVNIQGRRFSSYLAHTSDARINTFNLTIEKGSLLNAQNSEILSMPTLNIEGELRMNNTDRPLINLSSGSVPLRINLGEEAKVDLKMYNMQTALIVSGNCPVELSISKGAEFDFGQMNGGNIINAGTENVQVNLSSDRLALWDRGLQNEEKASMVFSDITATQSGRNGSLIESTNNERFQRIYDSANGLASYSRMSNQEVEEMNRVVKAVYVNGQGEEIAETEIFNGLLGDNYQTTDKEIPGYILRTPPSNEVGQFTREEIEVIYVYERSIVSPVDPLNPEIEVNPENKPEIRENQGFLSIDFVSQFDFAKQGISVQDKTYNAFPQHLLNEDGTINEAEKRPNYVQVSDRRSETERDGWQLAVTQTNQFTGASGQELTGAQLRFTNQEIASAQGGNPPSLQVKNNPLALTPGVRRTLIRAEEDEGSGTWVYRFGNRETSGSSVVLEVPKGANPDATTYTTTLNWELSSVPGN